MHLYLFLLFLPSSFFMLEQRAFAEPEVINQTADAITLTFARVVSSNIARKIKFEDCDRISSSAEQTKLDCKPALEKKYNAIFLRQNFYVLTPKPNSESAMQETAQFSSPLIEIEVAIAEESIDEINSIGFFTTLGSELLFFDPKKTSNFDRKQFRDGSWALIYKFLVDFPNAGRYRGQPVRSLGFKPFADFSSLEGNKIYRKWDQVRPGSETQNYYLIKGYEPYSRDVLVIDRRAEFLKQSEIRPPKRWKKSKLN